MAHTIHIVGLGPGPADLLTMAARSLLDGDLPIYTNAPGHPALPASAIPVEGDAVARLTDAAIAGPLIYAVTGDPTHDAAEAAAIHQAGMAASIDVAIHPGVSLASAQSLRSEATPPTSTLEGVAAIVRRLNDPDGCPWDNEQDHASLRKYLLEESHELFEAIDSEDRDAIVEELGDVYLQVLMHIEVGRRFGTFTAAEVMDVIGSKLVRRHPHVFGDADIRTAEDVEPMWEALKKEEKPERESVLDGVPAGLPGLAASQAIQSKARRAGFDWPDIEGPMEKLIEEVREFAGAEGDRDREDEFGDILFVLANIAQRMDVDAEQAMLRANAKFKRRFHGVERLARERELSLSALDLAGLDALWDEAKALLADTPTG